MKLSSHLLPDFTPDNRLQLWAVDTDSRLSATYTRLGNPYTNRRHVAAQHSKVCAGVQRVCPSRPSVRRSQVTCSCTCRLDSGCQTTLMFEHHIWFSVAVFPLSVITSTLYICSLRVGSRTQGARAAAAAGQISSAGIQRCRNIWLGRTPAMSMPSCSLNDYGNPEVQAVAATPLTEPLDGHVVQWTLQHSWDDPMQHS